MKKIVAAAAFLLIISCGEKHDLKTTQTFVGNAIGTTYGIKFFHDKKLDIKPDVEAIIDMFNQSMSTWVPDSRINQINAGDSTIVVGEAFKEVFDFAKQVHTDTDGYFDPTVGNLVNAYGFGADGSQEKAPSSQQIDSLLQYIGFDKMSITTVADGYQVQSTTKGMYLEFNAIGKGTLVDYIARMLNEKGVENYLVEVGGEVIAKGHNLEKDTDWLVGVNAPKKSKTGEKMVLIALNLKDKAMAGSGNYRKFKLDEESGQEYVHTVNPLTGQAVPSNVVAVNVIAENCTLADGYATAFMAMPLEKSKQLLPQLDHIEVLIMYLDEYGMLRFEKSAGFDAYVKK
ncbi:FAD:protein FMN transferase [Nonlabens sp.]|uniref:FAD:protein FMN transferase n=1 Tax=Nonlabens sp. TaxID=1888209 RepID=UPI003F69D045